MGGSRCSKTRTHVNLFNTMLLGGLWHGASWMYIIWGGWNGLLLIIHKSLRRIFPRVSEKRRNAWWRVTANVFLTFNLMAFGFMFFRARSMAHVHDMVDQMLHNFHFAVAPQFFSGYLMIVLAMAAGYLMHFAPKNWSTSLENRYGRLPLLLQSIIFAILLLVIIQVRQSDIVPFIYLQY